MSAVAQTTDISQYDNELRIPNYRSQFYTIMQMNIYTLQQIDTTQLVQGSDEYISAFESALSQTINPLTKNSVPKIPARPVRRGYLLSLAFTKYPDKSFDLFLIISSCIF